jgi:hypothetical protein
LRDRGQQMQSAFGGLLGNHVAHLFRHQVSTALT